MMSEIDQQLRNQVLQRDNYRCRECGVQVVHENGLKPHIHHIQPKSAGGLDALDNLITLREPCYKTRAHIHAFRSISRFLPRLYYVEWMIREIAIDLLFQAEHLNPRDFPARQVAADLQKAVEALQSVFSLFDLCPPEGTEIDRIRRQPDESDLNDVIEGVKISYKSHEYQKGLDEFLQRFWKEPS